MIEQQMGQDQKKWVKRIRAAGGEVDVHIVTNPECWIEMEDGPPIRVPVRMMESLMERNLFEVVENASGWTTYRLREGSG